MVQPQPSGNGASRSAMGNSFPRTVRSNPNGNANSSNLSTSRGKSSSAVNINMPSGSLPANGPIGSNNNLMTTGKPPVENSQMFLMSTTPSPFIQQIYSSRKKTSWQKWSDSFFNWIEGVPNEGLDAPLKSVARSRGRTRKRRGRSNSARQEFRKIFINCHPPRELTDASGKPNFAFPENGVKTTKYTVFSFIPKNLFEQFRRIANFVFIILAGLQFYPDIQTTEPVFGAVPIIIILTLTAFKDGVEDYKRHVADKSVNNDIVFRLEKYHNYNDRDAHPTYNPPPKADMESLRNALKNSRKGDPDSKPSLASRLKSSVNVIKKSVTSLKPMAVGNSSGSNAANYEMSQVSVDANLAVQSGSDKGNNGVRRLSKDSNTSSVRSDNRTSSGWYPILSKNLKVGDIIQLKNNENIPADIIVIATSEPDCLCYVETKNLDGETNLKIKRAPMECSWIKTAADCETAEYFIECDQPNISLYTFNGRLTFLNESARKARYQSVDSNEDSSKNSDDSKTISLSVASLLLRGCTLRNTNYVYGVVIGTGVDTKLMLNSGETPSKRSRIERRLNPQTVLNFLLLIIMSFLCSIIYVSFIRNYKGVNVPFLNSERDKESEAITGAKVFLSGLLLFQNIVPIALYLTFELCKTLQAMFIYSDVEMYHEETDTPCIPKSWNISDDLGQIEYIFSDKTGTLTRNVMELKKISIRGVSYGLTEFDFEKGLTPQDIGIYDDAETVEVSTEYVKDRMISEMKTILKPSLISDHQTMVDQKLFIQLRDDPNQSRHIIDYFRIITVCHTVLAQKSGVNNNTTNTNSLDIGEDSYHDIIYKAQSPDEEALVMAARNLGFTFVGRDKDNLLIDSMGKLEKYKILNILEFNSARKRMSVIVRKPTGEIILFCKGADSIIYERLADSKSEVEAITLNQLEAFAAEGLRTLCLAYRDLDEEEYQEWQERYTEAANSLDDRDIKIDACANEIEKSLILVGATAIEDKLQEGVPETIEILGRAGIKIWVLTGDKMETAINIGFSCNLLTRDMLLLVIKGVDSASVQKQVQDSLEQIFGSEESAAREKLVAAAMDAGVEVGVESGKQQQQNFGKNLKNVPIALIIDGHSLKFALEKESRLLFLELACRCKAVICCRVSPLQKAKVVELMKKGKKVMTLAIGDGANDVSMIQAADIGVGISGEEGVQAVMASDYAIAQFRYLKRLLLIHGRYSYIRTAELSLTAFYKNVIFTFISFWYQFYCAFSAELSYDAVYNMLYNLFLCNFPVVAVGFVDQDISQKYSLLVPQLYMRGILQQAYTLRLFFLYNLDGMYQSLICFFIPMGMYYNNVLGPQGYGDQKTLFGLIAAFCSIICANLFVGMNNYSWNYITVFAVFFGIVAFIILTVVINFTTSQMLFGSLREILVQPQFYFTVILTCIVTLLPRVLLKYLQTIFYPTDLDIIREIEKFEIANEVVLPASRRRSSTSLLTTSPRDASAIESARPVAISVPERTFSKIPGSGATAIPPPISDILPSTETGGIPSTVPSQAFSPAGPRSFGRRLLEGIRQPTNILYMRTGRFEKLRGFAFSQEEGMKDVVTGKAFGTVVKLRPELELKKIPKAAIRDNLRYPKGGMDASGSFNSIMSLSRDHAGSIMDTLGSLRSQSSSSNVRLDQIRSRNASGTRRFSTDDTNKSTGPSKKQ